jgi:hypothetical protein
MPQVRYVNTAKDERYVNSTPSSRYVNSLNVSTPDYPSSPLWRSAVLGSFAPSYVSVTNSLRRQARARGAQAFQLTLQYAAMTRAQFAPLLSFLTEKTVTGSTFTVRVPSFAARGDTAGTPQVSGSNQSGTSVATDGWGNNKVVLMKGDLIQFEGQAKVHMVTADCSSNGSGQATITFTPTLRQPPADNATVVVSPLFNVSLAGGTIEASYDQCVIVPDFEVVLVEVF